MCDNDEWKSSFNIHLNKKDATNFIKKLESSPKPCKELVDATKKVKVKYLEGKKSRDMIQEEIDIDKGITVDPRDWEVTDELIKKIEKI